MIETGKRVDVAAIFSGSGLIFEGTKVRVFIENSDTLRAETIQMRF